MNYISVAEARKLPGLRLILSVRVPNPWAESAKAVLSARGVKYIPLSLIHISVLAADFVGYPDHQGALKRVTRQQR